jgi:crotonobetainyl-CoA:carnitine CoA-transferase CaiB-like acyl-CoA transferase
VLPLADIRVLAIEQFGAGPWATLQLADLGAEVIKIEDPASGGDVGRYVPPFQEGEDSLFFETFNMNKKSVSLDLRLEDGRERFERLVRVSDVVFSNLRGDQPEKLRLRYDDLKHLNPRIVCCSLSGFGMTGPRASEGGYDYMMQGLAGWVARPGDPDGPPTKSGLSLVDLSGGYVAALTVLAGLWRSRRDGTGCDCDVALLDVALHELMYVGTWAASREHVPPRRSKSAHPSLVPFQNFETADGWIVVAAPKEKFWVRVCEAIGRPELASDPCFADFGARDRNREELGEILDDAFRARASSEWLEVLRAVGVPSSPVNEVLGAVGEARIVEYEHPTLGTVRQVASPLRLSDAEPPVGRAPFRGEHNGEVDDLAGA